jgi:hypothetical protein
MHLHFQKFSGVIPRTPVKKGRGGREGRMEGEGGGERRVRTREAEGREGEEMGGRREGEGYKILDLPLGLSPPNKKSWESYDTDEWKNSC